MGVASWVYQLESRNSQLSRCAVTYERVPAVPVQNVTLQLQYGKRVYTNKTHHHMIKIDQVFSTRRLSSRIGSATPVATSSWLMLPNSDCRARLPWTRLWI